MRALLDVNVLIALLGGSHSMFGTTPPFVRAWSRSTLHPTTANPEHTP